MAGGFWNKMFGSGGGLPRPAGIPDHVGRYLVVHLKMNPDLVWKFMAVVRPRGEKRGCFDVRVFDDVQARSRQIAIRDYSSLDDHPELITFEGWYDKNTNETQLVDHRKPLAS